MTREEPSGRSTEARPKRLSCRRTGARIAASEHESCPYCFGRLAEIEAGKHEAFCDYREGIDPIHFGFPAGQTRDERG